MSEVSRTSPERSHCLLISLNFCPRQGNVTLAKLLIDAGADLDYFDDTEFTALLWAVESSELEIVNLLLDAGNSRTTPCHVIFSQLNIR
jgi:ankyrin repeat protein